MEMPTSAHPPHLQSLDSSMMRVCSGKRPRKTPLRETYPERKFQTNQLDCFSYFFLSQMSSDFIK
jgi:hypothetical protein